MQEVLYVDRLEQATALLRPLRLELLSRMAQPSSCPDLGRQVGEPPQKVYYHVKVLEKAGLVERVDERRVRGIVEGLYRATARSYWLSPELAGHVGGPPRARDRLSLGFLLTLAEELQADVAQLATRASEQQVPSLGLSATLRLRDGTDRAAFLRELEDAFTALARKYGEGEGDGYRLALACYPKGESHE